MEVIAENLYNTTLPKFTMNSKSSIKIPEDKRYSIPPQNIRNRINSECLNFMNYQEIEKTANDQMKGIHVSEKRQRAPKEEKHVAIVHGV